MSWRNGGFQNQQDARRGRDDASHYRKEYREQSSQRMGKGRNGDYSSREGNDFQSQLQQGYNEGSRRGKGGKGGKGQEWNDSKPRSYNKGSHSGKGGMTFDARESSIGKGYNKGHHASNFKGSKSKGKGHRWDGKVEVLLQTIERQSQQIQQLIEVTNRKHTDGIERSHTVSCNRKKHTDGNTPSQHVDSNRTHTNGNKRSHTVSSHRNYNVDHQQVHSHRTHTNGNKRSHTVSSNRIKYTNGDKPSQHVGSSRKQTDGIKRSHTVSSNSIKHTNGDKPSRTDARTPKGKGRGRSPGKPDRTETHPGGRNSNDRKRSRSRSPRHHRSHAKGKGRRNDHNRVEDRNHGNASSYLRQSNSIQDRNHGNASSYLRQSNSAEDRTHCNKSSYLRQSNSIQDRNHGSQRKNVKSTLSKILTEKRQRHFSDKHFSRPRDNLARNQKRSHSRTRSSTRSLESVIQKKVDVLVGKHLRAGGARTKLERQSKYPHYVNTREEQIAWDEYEKSLLTTSTPPKQDTSEVKVVEEPAIEEDEAVVEHPSALEFKPVQKAPAPAQPAKIRENTDGEAELVMDSSEDEESVEEKTVETQPPAPVMPMIEATQPKDDEEVTPEVARIQETNARLREYLEKKEVKQQQEEEVYVADQHSERALSVLYSHQLSQTDAKRIISLLTTGQLTDAVAELCRLNKLTHLDAPELQHLASAISSTQKTGQDKDSIETALKITHSQIKFIKLVNDAYLKHA